MDQVIQLVAKPADLHESSRIASNVQLRNVRLVQCHAQLHASPVILTEPQEVFGLEIQSLPHELLQPHGLLLKVQLKLNIRRSIQMAGCDLNDLDDTVPLGKLELIFELEYDLPDGEIPPDIKDISLPQFARLNGPYHAWPYIRAEVQHLTGSMGLVPIILPVLVIKPLVMKKKSVIEDVEQKTKEEKPEMKKKGKVSSAKNAEKTREKPAVQRSKKPRG